MVDLLPLLVYFGQAPVKADGQIVVLRQDPSDRNKYLAILKRQNQQRSRQGLPPLPDPRTVTHTQPAVTSQPAVVR
jgi:hypothetical protein